MRDVCTVRGWWKIAYGECRSAAGVLVSDPKGRDIKIDSYTLSFHGRLLIEGAEVSLNYGQRYGLLGENGSGKVSRNRLYVPLHKYSVFL